MNRFASISAVILAALSVTACATKDPEALAANDPFEPTNRAVFDASMKVDKYFLKPVTQGYVAVVPEVARDGIHNMLVNINLPVVFGNEILQGSPGDAGDTLGRFIVNTTVGVGGFFDIATKIGIPSDDQDGGITFGKWGLSEGPYLFLPFLGPEPPRDLLGYGADVFMQPLHYADFPGDMTLSYARLGMGALDDRAATLDELEGIERSSVDFYATTRSLYRQQRAAKINGGKTNPKDLPNF